MTQPAVSVIIPVYNVEPFLAQCLDSVQAQTRTDIEVICVNDGSTDGSVAIMEAYAAADARFKLVNKKNGGYGSAMNCGLDAAQGTYIAIVEPDDWIEPRMFEDMLAFAARFEQPIDVIKTPYHRIWMPDTPQQCTLNCSYFRRIRPSVQPFTIDDPGASHLLCHHPSIWSALYRHKFLTQHGIRFKEIPGAGWADNPFLIETLCQAKTIVYLEQAYYCYREETPEKSRVFAQKNTLIPFERWNDMKDVLERLQIDDEGVLRAHNSRGFTYLSGVIEEVPLTDKHVHAAAVGMFDRMDIDLVMDDPEVSPGCKQMFLELRGLPPRRIAHLPHLVGLCRQAGYALRNVGGAHAVKQVGNYLSKRRRREGR
jgi:glycosyltransferase involved in cell wall biosynthesis